MLHQLNVYEHLYETNCIPEQFAEPEFVTCAGIFKQSLGARKRVGIGLSYHLARLHSLAE